MIAPGQSFKISRANLEWPHQLYRELGLMSPSASDFMYQISNRYYVRTTLKPPLYNAVMGRRKYKFFKTKGC